MTLPDHELLRDYSKDLDFELLADGAVGVAEAVQFAGVSRATLYDAMAEGQLAYLKRGRRRLIPRRALVAWLAAGLKPECRSTDACDHRDR